MSLTVTTKFVIRGEYAQRLYQMIRRYMSEGRYAYRTKLHDQLSEPEWFLGDIFSTEIGPGYTTFESVTDSADCIRINERGELELKIVMYNREPGLAGYLLRYFPDMEIYMLYSDDRYGLGTTIVTNDRDGSVFGVHPMSKEEIEESGMEYSFRYEALLPDTGESKSWKYMSHPEGKVYEDERLAGPEVDLPY